MSEGLSRLFDGRPLFLAPMAGVNDPAFRGLCKSQGAALTYTEMVSAKGFSYANPKTLRLLELTAEEARDASAAVQVFGHEPAVLSAMAAWLSSEYAGQLALIDINMGCPARKVASKGDGAALMRNLPLAEAVISAVVAAAAGLPVTVKFRSGFCANELNAVEFAQMAEAAGAAAVAVHGRTAVQGYTGLADKSVVAAVRAAVAIPVIASGDVFTLADADEYFDRYGASAVMIARGAQGRPWVFSGEEPDLEGRLGFARAHLEGYAALGTRDLSAMRKHLAWYLKGFPEAAKTRAAINSCRTLADYESLLAAVGEQLKSELF